MASKPWLDRRRMEWVMKYRPDPGGPWVRVKLGKHAGKVGDNPKIPVEAERLAREFQEIEFRSKHGLAVAPPKARDLKGYLDAYAESLGSGNRPSSLDQLRRNSERFVEFAARAGVVTLQSVTRAVCRDFIVARRKTVAVNTVRTERGFLIGAWSRAVEDGLIPSNPWDGAPVPGKVKPTAITFWSAEEIARIAAHCPRPWQSDFVLFMANTGLRVSTALAARWDWIDRPMRVLKIAEAEDVKTTYTHMLSGSARAILERRKGATGGAGLVFPGKDRDTPIPYPNIRAVIRAAIRRGDVRPGTPHDFRHSYGRAMALRVPITVVQKQLGHASLAMTMRYAQIDEEHVGPYIEDIDIGNVRGES